MIAFVTICGVLVLFGVLAAITAIWERMPTYPPYDDEVLPEPEIRARVRRIPPDQEWIIEDRP